MKTQMVLPEGKKATRIYSNDVKYFTRIGKAINDSIKEDGFNVEFFVETVNVVVNIGENNCADFIMSLDDWKALKNGEETSIITTEEFKKIYL